MKDLFVWEVLDLSVFVVAAKNYCFFFMRLCNFVVVIDYDIPTKKLSVLKRSFNKRNDVENQRKDSFLPHKQTEKITPIPLV